MAALGLFCYNSAVQQRSYHVDVFTSQPYSGNPGVVCLLSGLADIGWMQQVAGEVNVSDTALFYPGGDPFHLRWFTPTVEVDLCRHATLASAHVLREKGVVPAEETARFEAVSGLLTVSISEDLLQMDFPAEPAEAVEVPEALVASLGAQPLWIGRNRLDSIAELDSAHAVRELAPGLRTRAVLPGRDVSVTAASDEPEIDYVCRVFGPNAGIPEDTATGPTQWVWGPYGA